jgi:hypothetical protein
MLDTTLIASIQATHLGAVDQFTKACIIVVGHFWFIIIRSVKCAAALYNTLGLNG